MIGINHHQKIITIYIKILILVSTFINIVSKFKGNLFLKNKVKTSIYYYKKIK